MDNADIVNFIMRRIDEAIKAFHEENRKELGEKIHITEACGCLRFAYFRRKLGEKDDNIQYLFMGTAIHDAILKYIGEETEIHVENDILIGYADAIVNYNGERLVIELKTVKRLPQKPYKSHVEQLNAYLNLLGIEKGVIIYFERGSGNKAVFVIERDPTLFTITMEKARYLKECIEKNRPPEIKDESLCFMCPYRDVCESS